MKFQLLSINNLINLINYYWILGPVLLFFSGELSMTLFGLLYVRFPQTINLYILAINCITTAFLSEELFFSVPILFQNKLKKYEDHWLFKKIIKQNYGIGLLIFIFSRFFPVLRIISPIALGTTNIPRLLFSSVNLLISIIWCLSFIGLGVYIGKNTINLDFLMVFNIVEKKFNLVKNYFFIIFLSVIIVSVLIYLIKKFQKS